MAGHSKWANTKHRKAAQDAKKGKIFTRLIREITLASQMGGPEASTNPRLRAAVQTALSENMTKDTIDRAIKRGAGEDKVSHLEEIRYEGYGPGGVAIMVDCVTDNRNRTVSEVRHAFTKCGGGLGATGSVAYLFKKIGQIYIDGAVSEDQLMEGLLTAGASDFVHDEEAWCITTTAQAFDAVETAMTAQGWTVYSAELAWVSETRVTLSGDAAQQCEALLEALEALEDVERVSHTMAVSF